MLFRIKEQRAYSKNSRSVLQKNFLMMDSTRLMNAEASLRWISQRHQFNRRFFTMGRSEYALGNKLTEKKSEIT